MIKKIALILPYFGKFPNYFPLFLISCQKNPSIDWLIYTDIIEKYDWPQNVHVIYMSFHNFRDRLQRVISFPIELQVPYKLCDFKPVYGEALQDDLLGYDFWGYCDCDLIFGDIREFITDDLLTRYNKLFTRGHLSLYHNDSETNSFWRRQSIDLNRIFTQQKAFAFDEWGGVSRCWDESGLPYYDELVFDDIRPEFNRFRLTKEISGYGSPYHRGAKQQLASVYKKMRNISYIYNESGKLNRIWSEGRKIKTEEVLYVHMQKRKMEINVDSLIMQNGFLIIPNQFLPREKFESATLKKLVPDFLTLHDLKEYIKQGIRNIVK